MTLHRLIGAALMAASVCGFSDAAKAIDWSGFYLGANVGYARGNSDPFASYDADPTTVIVPAALPGLSSSSLIGGGQSGYNAQFGRWVLGGEADFSWLNADANGSVTPFWVTNPTTYSMTTSSRYHWLGTARLRTGLLLAPDLLVYATGGLAVTQVEDYAKLTLVGTSFSEIWDEKRILFGGAIGGGFEYAFSPQWTVKGEYLHLAFDDVLPQWSTSRAAGSFVAFGHSLDIVRMGVNYRWGAPEAMAAYAAARSTKTPAAPGRWTGFYAGLHAGYAWGNSDPFNTYDLSEACPDICPTGLPAVRPKGFIGGGQAGYNWQVARWVFGGEIDFSGLRAKSDETVAPFYAAGGDPGLIGTGSTATFSSQYDWLATARLRAGVLIDPDWLLYATGGLAMASAKDSVTYSSSITPEFTASQTNTLYGAIFGGGVEYAWSRIWSVKLEYLHVELNRSAPPGNGATYSSPDNEFNHRLGIVRAGVNLKLN